MTDPLDQDRADAKPGPLPGPGPNQSSCYADVSLLPDSFSGTIAKVSEALGEVTIVARRDGLVELLTFLRDAPKFQFNFLSDLSGLDLGEFAEPRFAVNYHL